MTKAASIVKAHRVESCLVDFILCGLNFSLSTWLSKALDHMPSTALEGQRTSHFEAGSLVGVGFWEGLAGVFCFLRVLDFFGFVL